MSRITTRQAVPAGIALIVELNVGKAKPLLVSANLKTRVSSNVKNGRPADSIDFWIRIVLAMGVTFASTV